MNLSESLAQYAVSIEEWLKKSKKATAATQRLLKEVQLGNLKQIEGLRRTAMETTSDSYVAAEAMPGFQFDGSSHLQDPQGYVKELLAVAEATGVKIYPNPESDRILFCYPVLIKLEPAEQGVRLDKKLTTRIHPNFLVKELARLQKKSGSNKPEKFIELLLEGYQLALAKKGIQDSIAVSLMDIYKLLTILPDSRKNYTEMDFIRDVYFLDGSGVTTINGYKLSLLATRPPFRRFITRDGQERLYAQVKFTK